MPADLADVRRRTHQRLLTQLTPGSVVDETLVSDALATVAPLLERDAFEGLVAEVLAEVHGLGPLDALLADPEVTDLMVVGDRGTWVERNGELIDTGLRLTSDEVMRVVERVVAPLGRRVDRASPMVDARLADGSRVNVVVPPLAVDGPCLSIRRFAARTIPLEALASDDIASLLGDAVRERLSILVTGGTGSGKTTLLNALGSYIGDKERVVTVEDAAELRLPLRHVVRLESRPPSAEGSGEVTLRDLVRNALRMRPDRIVVGEVRGPEALDMLQAMNTGHEGSMSTCHANSPVDALHRIETMVMMANLGLSTQAVRRQILSGIDLVVQVARCDDGSRRVVAVGEVSGSEDRLHLDTIASRRRP